LDRNDLHTVSSVFDWLNTPDLIFMPVKFPEVHFWVGLIFGTDCDIEAGTWIEDENETLFFDQTGALAAIALNFFPTSAETEAAIAFLFVFDAFFDFPPEIAARMLANYIVPITTQFTISAVMMIKPGAGDLFCSLTFRAISIFYRRMTGIDPTPFTTMRALGANIASAVAFLATNRHGTYLILDKLS